MSPRNSMRQAIAHLLTRMAARIHTADHKEIIEVHDDYGVLRCRVEVMGDDHHGVDAAFVRLPQGWECFVLGKNDYSRSDM